MLRLVLPEGLARTGDPPTVRRRRPRGRARLRRRLQATIDDPRVIDVTILRPQEIPRYVADGLFDLGVTGRDWIEETGADVVTLTELHYSKATARPIRMVLAVAGDSPWTVGRRTCPRACACTPSTPSSRGASSRSTASTPSISLSYGATEAKIPEIADAVVEITETGRALRAAGLKVLDTILVSYTELIANPIAYADADKRKAMEQLQTLLRGALEARGRVLVKLNVDEANLARGDRPAARAEVADGVEAVRRRRLRGRDASSPRATSTRSIPALKDAGATGILEIPIAKIVQ